MKNTPSNHTRHSSTPATTPSLSAAAAAAGLVSVGDGTFNIPDLASSSISSKQQQRSKEITSTVASQRLNANCRLSTAFSFGPSSIHQQGQQQQAGSREEAGLQQYRDWTSYSSCSFPLHQQQGLCSLVGEIYEQYSQEPSSTTGLFATPSLPESMTAAAAATVVAKFEPGTQMSMATASSSSSSIPSNGFCSTSNWSSHSSGMPSDWELAAAAAIGRGHGFEPRMISTPPYYNSASNYAAASNAAYLYSPQHCYGLQRTGSSAAAVPFHNYLAATNTAAVAAAGCLNYGTTAAAYGSGGPSTNLTDYYGFNYYGGSNSGMLNPSPMHDFGNSTRTAGYCDTAIGQCNVYKSTTNNSRAASSTISGSSSSINTTSDLNSTAVTGGRIGRSNNNSLPSCAHQLSPLATSPIKVEKTRRPKKRKMTTNGGSIGATTGVSTTSPTEPNNTRVFVWELEDLCVLASHPYRTVDTFMLQVIEQILRCAFLVEHLDECDQANIEDIEVEEPMQESVSCNLLATSTAKLQNTNGLCSATKSNASTSLFECGSSSHANGSSPTALLSIAQQPANPSKSSTAHNFPSIMMSANNGQITDPVMCGLSNSNTDAPSTVNKGMLEGLKRMAAKYQHIKGTYEKFKNNLLELLDFCGLSTQSSEIVERFQSYDKFSGCQTERYKRCLKIINERSDLMKDKCTNVVFTSESVACSLAKLMAFDLAHFVTAENVYSTAKNGKEAMLARICERFKKQRIVIISSSLELSVLAKNENIPFWKINNLIDVDALYFALDTILLADTMTSQQAYLTQTKCVNDNR